MLIPKLLGELIDVLAKMGALGGGGIIKGPSNDGAGDVANFRLISPDFLAKIKGPSIVLAGTLPREIRPEKKKIFNRNLVRTRF